MPFIPHTEQDIHTMLQAIGVSSIQDLFDEIPAAIACGELTEIPDGLNEMAVTRLMQEREPEFQAGRCFIGAGAYSHYIPAAVWQIAGRGEFYTAYTPYQAEASQGSLQLIYEYQSMITQLMAMDVSNASLYDGATALVEACLMAVRIKKHKATRILVPESVHPAYKKVLQTFLAQRELELVSLPFDQQTGTVKLAEQNAEGAAALIIPQPNFFGCLEEVDQLTEWAEAKNILVIGLVNPTAMALLKPPGEWGKQGADIVCAEGQPLGIPLSYGGPYFGIMCCKAAYVRQLPGRLVGKTVDTKGREGYTLTLQAREQHIRRAKATSNICTNQGLMVVAATIYLSLLGSEGLREVALSSHQNAVKLLNELEKISGIKRVFPTPFLHEFVIEIPGRVKQIVEKLSAKGLHAGYVLSDSRLLVCVTETKTEQDLAYYVACMQELV